MDNELITLSQSELEKKLLEEVDLDNINNIIDIFNINNKKREVLRVNKLSCLQDKISDQISERIDKKADEFSNKDLLDYFKVVQETIDKSNTKIEPNSVPSIQINQQNINIGQELNKESRDKVSEAVKNILAKLEKPANELEVKYEIKEEE